MSYDLLIRGGLVIDPANERNGPYDVAVADGRIAAVAPELPLSDATTTIDARGQIVTPGLIDLHTHCFWGATYWGIEADPIAARSGVTTWIDAGSAGAYTFPGFRRYVIERSRIHLSAFLNISTIGLTGRTHELSDLAYCDTALAAATIDANRDCILGVKARIDRDTTRGTGPEGLRRARHLADTVDLPLMVHIGTAPPSLHEIAAFLHPGDILTHCCTGLSNRLIDADGSVFPEIRRLWEQGVILDLGHGTGSFSYASATAMLEAGLVPDVISSDIHQLSVRGPMYDLPTTLSKFLALGLTLPEVIARATTHPAAALRHPALGTLTVGVPADIALFRLEEASHIFYDSAMTARHAGVRLVNTATYIGGVALPSAPESAPAPWVAADLPAAQQPLLTNYPR